MDRNFRSGYVTEMQPRHLHQQPYWPEFTWDDGALAAQIGRVRHLQEQLSGRMQALGLDLWEQATLEKLTSDVVKTSAIEGEVLNEVRGRSSTTWHLDIGDGGVPSGDQHIEGIFQVTLDSTQRYDQALTGERVLGWHAALFPTGRGGP